MSLVQPIFTVQKKKSTQQIILSRKFSSNTASRTSYSCKMIPEKIPKLYHIAHAENNGQCSMFFRKFTRGHEPHGCNSIIRTQRTPGCMLLHGGVLPSVALPKCFTHQHKPFGYVNHSSIG